jgi:hypothetical protein
MKLNQIFRVALALVIAFSVIASQVVIADAAGRVKIQNVVYGKSYDVALGQAGIYIPSSGMTAELRLRKITPHHQLVFTNYPNFTSKWWEVQFYQGDDRVRELYTSLTYVYFKLTRKEYRAYTEGRLTVYYYSEAQRDFVECSTIILAKKSGNNRLGCIAFLPGIYALGEK